MNTSQKALVIALKDPQVEEARQQSSLTEVSLLLNTYGAEVAKVITQNASHRTSSLYIGQGKAEEVAQIVSDQDISIVVINDHLDAGQLFRLRNIISPDGQCYIWDRTQLILQIFKNHAHTAEAKLQIKLAELNHKGPELSGLGIAMSQQAGGIGTRGIGETNTEIMRRHWSREVKKVEDKLKKVLKSRQQQIQNRKKLGAPSVSIVGYTNTGKTTLFNAISSKKDLAKDALFATLDSSVSDLYLPNVGKKIFVTDTIGFIQDLPTSLIDAFRSTLMETVHADLLLHVIDVSDNNFQLKIDTVNEIIHSLDIESIEQIYVFNKSDLISAKDKKIIEQIFAHTNHVFVSAKKEDGIEELVTHIENKLMKQGLKRAKHLEYLDHLEN